MQESMAVHVLILCLVAASATASDDILNNDLQRFILHYIHHQNYQRLHILQSYNRQGNASRLAWVRWTSSTLLLSLDQKSIYSRLVQRPENLLQYQQPPVGSANMNGTSAEKRGGEPRYLILAPLLSKEDQLDIAELMSIRHYQNLHWIFVTANFSKHRVNGVYLSLDNNIIFVGSSPSLLDSYMKADNIGKIPLQLWEGYQAGPHFPQHLTQVGSWRPGQLFMVREEAWTRRKNLDGLVLRCTTIQSSPFSILKNKSDGTVSLDGLYADFLKQLERQLNFTSVLVMKRPTSLSNIWTSYTKVFTTTSWILTLVCFFCLSFAIKMVTKLSVAETHLTWSDAVLIVVAGFTQRDICPELKNNSSRIAVYTMFLISVLLFSFYTCNLISALTVGKVSPPFTDLKGMYESRTHTFGFFKGSAMEEYFRTANDGLYRNIWNDMVKPNYDILKKDIDENIDMVMAGDHVSLEVRPLLLKEYYHCGLMILPGLYFWKIMTWPMAPDLPVFPIINHHMYALAENGVYDKLHRKWYPRDLDCETTDMKALSFPSVCTAFIILLAALLLASICMVVEIIAYRKFNKDGVLQEEPTLYPSSWQ